MRCVENGSYCILFSIRGWHRLKRIKGNVLFDFRLVKNIHAFILSFIRYHSYKRLKGIKTMVSKLKGA